MKNFLFAFILLSSAVVISSCAKERIAGCTDPYALNFDPKASDNDNSCWVPIQNKKVLMANVTATDCDECGDSEDEEFLGAIHLTTGLAEPMYLHLDDDMGNDLVNELLDYYEITSAPNIKVWETGDGLSDSLSVAGAVGLELEDKPLAEAGAVVNIEDNGQRLEVQLSAGVFLPATGDYFVAAYILEDGLVFPQKGANTVSGSTGYPYLNTYVHNGVLRASANGTWGEQFIFGAALPGQVKTVTYQMVKDPSWNMANLYAIAVIWKYIKDPQYGEFKYEFVNVSSSRDILK